MELKAVIQAHFFKGNICASSVPSHQPISMFKPFLWETTNGLLFLWTCLPFQLLAWRLVSSAPTVTIPLLWKGSKGPTEGLIQRTDLGCYQLVLHLVLFITFFLLKNLCLAEFYDAAFSLSASVIFLTVSSWSFFVGLSPPPHKQLSLCVLLLLSTLALNLPASELQTQEPLSVHELWRGSPSLRGTAGRSKAPVG